ncbi:MAG: TauD/TfdA family dioxygenase, partial [Alphaproteobacteria bacterium]|nr:TauD/TfdA family dioxygenase [Alphaproteobacteria bacterium]
SVFVDGFRAAETLREENPEAFDLLARYKADFRFKDATTDLKNRTALIGVDDRGHLTHIRYNNRSAAPLQLPASIMQNYYEALLIFSNMLHRPELEVTFKLQSGELVLFDNERILHGRKGFAGKGERHLQGSYADKDSLNSYIDVQDRAN